MTDKATPRPNVAEVSGTVKLVGETQTVGAKGFSKRQLVVETDGKYPQLIAVEFHKERTSVLDPVQPGDFVTVRADIRGREWNGRYYVSLVGWGLDHTPAQRGEQAAVEAGEKKDDPLGGLPF